MRRTFTYALPAACPPLSPGQRLLVPFGRAHKAGFYIGPADAPDGVTIKQLIRPLDPVNYFPDDLFRFCLWMADYYFANPADCLAAALPPAVKGEAAARFCWGEPSATMPQGIRNLVRPGRRLNPDDFRALRGLKLDLRRLVAEELIKCFR